MSIEDNPDPYVKAAFYEDPDVMKIVERLYKRWEENECKGEPLDYATIEELELLVEKARRYRYISVGEYLRKKFMES